MTEPYSHPAQAHAFEPTAGYRYLREQCPVYREDAHDPPFYVLSRFDDVRAALKAPQQWSSKAGPGVFFQESGVLASADDPDHARHRRVLRDAFVPTAIDRLEPAASEIADELFAEMLPRGEGDFVDLFAFPFPAMVIGELLGVHREDRDDFRRWSSEVVQALTGGSLADYARAKACIEDYVEARMLERETAGGELPEDALTRMLMAWREGVLTTVEVRHLGHQVLIAGHETTTSLLGLMLYRLIERPKVFEELRADPMLLDAAIEEALRFELIGPAVRNESFVLHGLTSLPIRWRAG